MPSQKEPHTSQGLSLSSMTKLGSMAFQLSPEVVPSAFFFQSWEVTMHPSSFHMPERSERLLSRPIAEPFLPKVEQL